MFKLCYDLQKKQKRLITGMIEYLSKNVREQTNSILENFNEIHEKIRSQPQNIEELTELRRFIQIGFANWMDEKEKEIKNCLAIYDMLEELAYKLRSDDYQKRWIIFGIKAQTEELIRETLNQLDQTKTNLMADMIVEQTTFKRKIDQLEREISGFHQHNKIEDYKQIAKRVAQINDILQQFTKDATKFNQREQLFEKEHTDYTKIALIQKDFQPYLHLWSIADKWNTEHDGWLHSPWHAIDAIAIQDFIEESYRNLINVVKFMKEREIHLITRLAEKIKLLIEDFKPQVPLLVALKKEGMKQRHWDQVAQYALLNVTDPAFSFQHILDAGLMNHIDFCISIGEQASKEYQIELTLKNMKATWETLSFELVPYKKISFVLKKTDEIQNLIDDHLLQTQSMQFSVFKKPFEQEIVDWY